MDFDETLSALDGLLSHQVQAEIWGRDGGAPLAFLSGQLKRMAKRASSDPSGTFTSIEGEEAEIFLVGTAQLDFWPSRFVASRWMSHADHWLEVETRDGVVRVGPERERWIS